MRKTGKSIEPLAEPDKWEKPKTHKSLKRVVAVENRIALPDYITKACGDALAHYCTERGVTSEKAVRELAALVEETAQRIQLALVQQHQS